MSAVVVCPACHGPLAVAADGGATCQRCGIAYAGEGGRPVLLVPGDDRFDDAADCCLFADEELTNAFTTKEYHLPLLRRLFASRLSGASLLSAGCGVGIDVDLYRAAGLDAHGVDCGSRSHAWSSRRHPEAFAFGSVARLPFPDDSFDVVVTGCLLPHIGVVGDSVTLKQDGLAERRRVADELLRVTKPGGHLVMGNPNRLCPADLFHKGQMSSASSLVRWHRTDEAFLLSFADYVAMFGSQARLRTLPVSRYWGFHSKERQASTRVLARLLRAYFALLSLPPLGALRRSFLNPWLMVLATKSGGPAAGGAAAANP